MNATSAIPRSAIPIAGSPRLLIAPPLDAESQLSTVPSDVINLTYRFLDLQSTVKLSYTNKRFRFLAVSADLPQRVQAFLVAKLDHIKKLEIEETKVKHFHHGLQYATDPNIQAELKLPIISALSKQISAFRSLEHKVAGFMQTVDAIGFAPVNGKPSLLLSLFQQFSGEEALQNETQCLYAFLDLTANLPVEDRMSIYKTIAWKLYAGDFSPEKIIDWRTHIENEWDDLNFNQRAKLFADYDMVLGSGR